MKNYTTYCTEKITVRAYNLGAPIEKKHRQSYLETTSEKINGFYLVIPTTQQMLGWLRKIGIEVTTNIDTIHMYHSELKVWKLNADNIVRFNNIGKFEKYYKYENAELAGINAALNYLENNKI